jgi:molecular chaperone Hsp33
MIKKKPFGESLKEQLIAAQKDRLFRFVLADGTCRGALLHGTRMVNEMQANHQLGPLETLVLGHGYIAGGLMAAGLKGDDRLSIQIKCSGPIKGLVVEANAFGEVRGYLKQVPIPIEKTMETANLSSLWGAGFLTVTRHLRDAKQPFTSQVPLVYSEVALNLANYFLTSEQIPTSFSLSLQFDKKNLVLGAGGLLLQALPGAEPVTITQLEARVRDLPSLGRRFAQGQAPGDFINESFQKFHPNIIGDYRIEFMCHCNEERIRNMLMMLPIADLKDMADNGPFPIEVLCHNCGTPYLLDQDLIRSLYAQRYPSN